MYSFLPIPIACPVWDHVVHLLSGFALSIGGLVKWDYFLLEVIRTTFSHKRIKKHGRGEEEKLM